jgi:N-acetylglucosaminyl-diphospho-decaprenol L-rhamnosyltransferase
MPRDLDIVLVNWNSGPHLSRCLRSIPKSVAGAGTRCRVFVVDNASTDGSVGGLDASAGEGGVEVVTLRNAANRGFAAACNQGVALGTAPYVLLLNTDTVLFADSLKRPLEFMEDAENAHVGICGVRLVTESGGYTTSCARFPTAWRLFTEASGLTHLAPKMFPPLFMSERECLSSREVDQIIGAFFLVRRTLYEELGGLDERFFVYFEEVDFCYRARVRGYASVYLSDATAQHYGGGSTEQVKATRLFYSLRSRILYGRKHFSGLAAGAIVATVFTIEFPVRLAVNLVRGGLRAASETLTAYRLLVKHLTTAE